MQAIFEINARTWSWARTDGLLIAAPGSLCCANRGAGCVCLWRRHKVGHLGRKSAAVQGVGRVPKIAHLDQRAGHRPDRLQELKREPLERFEGQRGDRRGFELRADVFACERVTGKAQNRETGQHVSLAGEAFGGAHQIWEISLGMWNCGISGIDKYTFGEFFCHNPVE